MKCTLLAQIVLIGTLLFVAGVLSYTDAEDHSNAASPAEADHVPMNGGVAEETHHVRSKRSPADPVLASLLIAKSFILGGLLGSTLGRHHGGGRPGRGWGWSRVSRSHTPYIYASGWQPGPPVSYGHGGWK